MSGAFLHMVELGCLRINYAVNDENFPLDYVILCTHYSSDDEAEWVICVHIDTV